MKRKINFNLIVSILLLVISLAMAGLFSWAIAGFRPDPLSDDKFWFSLIISTIINLFSLLSAISYDLPEQLENNADVKEKRKALLEINISTDATKLEEFTIDANLQRKKAVYLKDLENKPPVSDIFSVTMHYICFASGSKETKHNVFWLLARLPVY